MPRSKRLDMGTIREQGIMQKEIRERFGEKAILVARKRLCEKCKALNCSLLPITTRGEDCPYFPFGVKKP